MVGRNPAFRGTVTTLSSFVPGMVRAKHRFVRKTDARMSCKILISTTVDWVATARHAAGFALAGCTVDAVAPRAAPIAVSRYISRSYRYRALSPLTSLRSAIQQAKPDLIVNGDDRAVDILLKLYDAEPKQSAMAALISRSLGLPEQYARAISRDASLTAARSLGIRVPDTLPVPDEAELEDALEAIGFPAVLKVDGSWGGAGVAAVRTKADALTAFRRLARPLSPFRCVVRAAKRQDAHWLKAAWAPQTRPVSIQKFVAGRPAASGFAAWQGEVVGAVYYDVLKADGVTGPPRVVRRVDCPEIAEATRLLTQHFGLSGLHGLDFIRDSEGHVHLLEINPRATQGGTLPFGPGRDLAAALAACVSTEAKPRPSIEDDTVVFFPGEWLRDPGSAWFRTAHHDVPWDDPVVLRVALKGARFPDLFARISYPPTRLRMVQAVTAGN